MGAPRIDRLDKNFIINSALENWQRGTSVTINTASGLAQLIADRFHYGSTGSTVKNYSIQRSTDVPNGQSRFSYQWNCLTAIPSPSASDYVYPISVRLEGLDAKFLYGKKVTIGVWIKPTLPVATFPVQTSISINLIGSTSNQTYIKPITLNQNNTWQWVAFEVEINSNDVLDTSLGMVIGFFISGGTNGQAPSSNTWVSGTYYYGVGDYNMMSNTGNILWFAMPTLVIGGTELDGGISILAGRNPTEELVLCQRYYEFWTGRARAALQAGTNEYPIPMRVVKRTTPIVTVIGDGGIAVNVSANGFSLNTNSTATGNIIITMEAEL